MMNYELMKELAKLPAGAPVYVQLPRTMNAGIEDVVGDDESIIINCGDVEVVDANGDSLGNISELTAVEEED